MGKASGPILIVSWTVFPEQAAMSLLTHQLAKTFNKKEIVVVGERSDHSSDWDEPPQYPLYHIDPFPFSFNKGKQYFKWLKLNTAIKQVEGIVEKHNCSAILCSFPDEFYMYVSYKVAQKKKLSFYPWFHNTYLENRTGLLQKVAKRLQPLFFNSAKKVFSISQGLTDYYTVQYPKVSFSNLLHGFILPETNFEKFRIRDNEKIRFAYTGSLNESCRDAAVRLAKIIISNPNYELHIFGKRNAETFKTYGIDGANITVYGFLSDDEFNKKLKDCHIMLLPHGFDGGRSEVEYKTIFPTRTIPLLYTNRPIILHSPPNASLTTFFKKNNCGHIIDTKDEEIIENSISDLIKNKELINTYIQNAIKISKDYDVKTVAENLKKQVGFGI